MLENNRIAGIHNLCYNSTVIPNAPVAQWIEHRSPEPGAEVRFLSGAPVETCNGTAWQFRFFYVPQGEADEENGGGQGAS